MSTINTGLHYPLDLTQLPTGWHADYVGAFAAEIQSGFACGRHSSEDIGVPHLRPMNVTREGRVDLSEIKYVPLDHDDRRLQENDVLFNNTNSPQLIGKTAFVDARAAGLAFSNHMTRVRFASKVDPKFAAFQLHYLWMAGYYLHKCVKHVNQASISSRDFARMIPFVAPPLNEQHRIVAQIEALLSALDKGIEKLNAARFQLRAYRAAVLDNGLHSGGHDVDHRPLGELIGSIQQGWSPKCDPNRTPDDGEWGVIKTTTIQPMQYLPNQCKPLPPELDPRSNIEIHERDLLMTRKGPRHRTGVVCLVRGVRKRSMLCDTVYRFRADESKVSPEYLEIALNAPSVVAALDKKNQALVKAASH